jgi:curved DNA-binding protein CbpA
VVSDGGGWRPPHPDAQPHDPQAAARYRALTGAYELLSNPDRRADYDRSHPAAEPSRQPPRPGRPAAGPRRSSLPYLPGPPPSQLIWAGPAHVQPPPTATAASSHRRSTPAAELEDPIVILAGRPGQVRDWPW